MNIANTVASKLFVAFVAAAMLVMLATPAKAATAEELQAQIDALMAQISALQGGKTAPAATSAAAKCTFTGALTVGSQGADVKCLQDYLTPTYFTNAGGSTGYFGPVTASAVAKWQTANGVTPAAGYFGPVSQAKYNALVAAAPATGDTGTGTGDTSTSDDSTSGSASLSGEASLDDVTVDSASDDTLDEGQEAEVAVATFNFVDGDAKITRMDVTFNGSADVWDVLDEVSLVVDGKTVATEDASDEDNYKDTSSHSGTIRFTGLNIVGQEDEDLEVSVVAKIQGTVDSGDFGSYTAAVDSVRYVDGEDVTSTDDATGDLGSTVSFTVQGAGADDEIIVKTSSSDPDATTLELKDDAKSDWYTVFAFDIDTKDSTNDVDLKEVPVTVVVSSSTFDGLVDDYELVIDGTTIDKLADNNGGSAGNYTNGATTVLTFNVDKDVTVSAGDRVKAELRLKFKALALGNEGVTVQGKVTSGNASAIDAEGSDTVTALSGSATGDTHTLRTSGVFVSEFSSDVNVTTSDTATNSYGEFVLTFDVTAIGSDEVYVPLTTASSTESSSTTKGAIFKLANAAGTSIPGADSISASLTRVSGGDTSTSGYVRLDSDETATFKLTVTFNPLTSAQYVATLQSVGFAATAAPATVQTAVSPATDYDTDPTYIAS